MLNRKNRILLKELTKTDFKLRYQGSALGYLWAIIRPLMMFVILYVVFVKFLRFGSDIPHYAIYLLTGIVFWNFFTESTSQGMQAVISRGDLLRKINFPKYIVVISATMTALINFLINLTVIFIFAIVTGVEFRWTILLLPLIIAELYLLSLGLSFFLGALNVKYRDISSIWEVIIQALFYAVPIIYPLSMIISYSPVIAQFIILNPIAQVIQDARYALVTPETITVWNLSIHPALAIIPLTLTALFFIFSVRFFNKRAKYFAEEY